MEHISELRDSLNIHFGWNKARMTCFVKMLLALIVAQTVNLSKMAPIFSSEAKKLSRYRRMQRFFAWFVIDYDIIASFIFRLLFVAGGKWVLTMDRTNWKWGKSNINILTLGIAYKGTAIPIYWELLDKRGNSDTEERIALIKKFIQTFGKENIAELLCDREFVGEDWFKWLLDEKISFCIRIKNNTVTTNARGEKAWMNTLFYGLKCGENRTLEGKRKVTGCFVYLSGLRLEDGELLIVTTDREPENAIKRYAARWEIETLFGCLKGRGFNFEDTHIVDQERIKKLFVLLAIAFCWAHKTGEWQHEVKPIKIKKHGRPTMSLFRYGLDYLVEAIVNVFSRTELFAYCLARITIPVIEPGSCFISCRLVHVFNDGSNAFKVAGFHTRSTRGMLLNGSSARHLQARYH